MPRISDLNRYDNSPVYSDSSTAEDRQGIEEYLARQRKITSHLKKHQRRVWVIGGDRMPYNAKIDIFPPNCEVPMPLGYYTTALEII